MKLEDRIKEFIDWEVKKAVQNEAKYKEHYYTCISIIEQELNLIEEFIIDSEESHLPINKIEQEGYKRALITMLHKFKFYLDNL